MRPPNIQLAEREGNPGERTLLRVCTAAGPPGMKSLGGRRRGDYRNMVQGDEELKEADGSPRDSLRSNHSEQHRSPASISA